MPEPADQQPFQRGGQHVDLASLGKRLEAIQEQQKEQTKYLRNISTAATIIGMVVIFGTLYAACSALM